MVLVFPVPFDFVKAIVVSPTDKKFGGALLFGGWCALAGFWILLHERVTAYLGSHYGLLCVAFDHRGDGLVGLDILAVYLDTSVFVDGGVDRALDRLLKDVRVE